MAIPKFSSGGQGTFHADLKKRIQDYFTKSGKSTTGNFSLFFKGGLLFTLLVLIYIHLVFFTPVAWLAITESALLGLVISAIGFNVMHDGAHGSFSKYKWVNKIAAYTLNLLGGNAFMWNMKHNIIHHSYTNIEGVDDDIEIQPWLRMSPAQKKYKMHKYQHRYFWFLYSLLYIFWVFLLDYTKYFRGRIGPTPLKKMSVTDHITFWSFKVLHYFIFIALPVIMLGWIPWLIGFLTCTLLAGFVLSIVFQLAHTVEDTEFPHAVEPTNRMPDEWAVHQIKTTANFATRNKVISWLVGGLNFQIEHHLFPKISHVHYPAISKILRQVCREYNITYVEYPYMLQAVASHVTYLKKMGRV
ncbi:MAG TPA: acyl-CoA desaturase [Chitinophagaceae bacterium]|nr:acyl-CoA desaturase [Chitinophagaceae bacterium]